jgi:hypothetical protein
MRGFFKCDVCREEGLEDRVMSQGVAALAACIEEVNLADMCGHPVSATWGDSLDFAAAEDGSSYPLAGPYQALL